MVLHRILINCLYHTKAKTAVRKYNQLQAICSIQGCLIMLKHLTRCVERCYSTNCGRWGFGEDSSVVSRRCIKGQQTPQQNVRKIDLLCGTEQGHPMSPELYKCFIHQLSVDLFLFIENFKIIIKELYNNELKTI